MSWDCPLPLQGHAGGGTGGITELKAGAGFTEQEMETEGRPRGSAG